MLNRFNWQTYNINHSSFNQRLIFWIEKPEEALYKYYTHMKSVFSHPSRI